LVLYSATIEAVSVSRRNLPAAERS